jgi:hypothetical protein
MAIVEGARLPTDDNDLLTACRAITKYLLDRLLRQPVVLYRVLVSDQSEPAHIARSFSLVSDLNKADFMLVYHIAFDAHVT